MLILALHTQGLMLEQSSSRLYAERSGGGPYGIGHASPSKEPGLRLGQLELSGRLGVPFTTGLLVGIGETPLERCASAWRPSALNAPLQLHSGPRASNCDPQMPSIAFVFTCAFTCGGRRQTLEDIAEAAQRHGHIQECIVQPYSRGERDTWAPAVGWDPWELPRLVELARSAHSHAF